MQHPVSGRAFDQGRGRALAAESHGAGDVEIAGERHIVANARQRQGVRSGGQIDRRATRIVVQCQLRG